MRGGTQLEVDFSAVIVSAGSECLEVAYCVENREIVIARDVGNNFVWKDRRPRHCGWRNTQFTGQSACCALCRGWITEEKVVDEECVRVLVTKMDCGFLR